jgi:5S rRNA maturation endonuclease (ribonuclease M5)
MIKGTIKFKINLEKILEEVSEYDIYKYYLGRDFTIGKNIESPFRKDSTPSFCIYVGFEGRLRHIDYGQDEYNGNCVSLVMQLYGLQYGEAIQRIYEEVVKNGTYKNTDIYVDTVAKQKHIQVVSKAFTLEELNYWRQYEITEKELKDNKVYSISRLYIDRVRIYNYNSELKFAYIFDNKYVKIYTPYPTDKSYKFITNAPIDQISGLDRCTGGDRVFICSSKKDEMVVRKLDHACSSQNESKFSINPATIALLKSRYKDVYLWFDQDRAGHEAAEYYESEYGLKSTFIPEELKAKDPSDLVQSKGLQSLKEVYDRI